MSIYLPEGLPARSRLESEGIEFFDLHDPLPRGILPLRIALLNLMPHKDVTETHFARVLGAQALPVELVLVVPEQYRATTTAPEHIARYYRTWREIRHQSLDGLIVTGAPVETLPYEEVAYWPELRQIFDWALGAVPGSLYVCWAAQAALYHRHGVAKHLLREKAFGVYKHAVRRPGAAVLRGFDRELWVPVSRHTEVRAGDIPAHRGIDILADSPETGLCLLEGDAGRSLYMFNHLEYDTDTLAREHARDLEAGKYIRPPENYYPAGDPARAPRNRWRPYAHMFFSNWLAALDAARFTGIDVAA